MLLQAFRAAGLSAALNIAPALTVPALTQGLSTKAKAPRKKKSLPQVLSDKVSVASKRKKPAGKKAEKKEKPPRAKTAYTFFVKEQLLHRNKDQPVVDSFRELAGKWKALSEPEKEPFLKLAEQSKAEVKAAREAIKAKRPPTNPFATFVKEQMGPLLQSNPGATVPELMRTVSELWKQVPAAEKTRRSEQYLAAKALYKASQEEQAAEQQ